MIHDPLLLLIFAFIFAIGCLFLVARGERAWSPPPGLTDGEAEVEASMEASMRWGPNAYAYDRALHGLKPAPNRYYVGSPDDKLWGNGDTWAAAFANARRR